MQHELERARLKAGKVPNVGQEGHSMNAYSSTTDVNKFSQDSFSFGTAVTSTLPYLPPAEWGIPEVSAL